MTPCELLFIFRNFQLVDYFELYFLEVEGYGFSQEQKTKLLKYQNMLPCSINFQKIETIKDNWFDMIFCFGTLFRSVSSFRYNAENEALKKLGIDTKYPLFSDTNDIVGFVNSIMNCQKFLLNSVKVGGFILSYPLTVPFSVFAACEQKDDFVIKDVEAEVTWINTSHSHWPDYITTPISLQLFTPSTFREKLEGHISTFIASELLDDKTGVTVNDVTYDLKKIAPKLMNFFSKKGIQVIPSIFTVASCIQKTKHVNYKVDMVRLRTPLQLPTETMRRISSDDFLQDPKNRRYVSRVYYGGRYQLCAKELRRVCQEIDKQWFQDIYGSCKGF